MQKYLFLPLTAKSDEAYHDKVGTYAHFKTGRMHI